MGSFKPKSVLMTSLIDYQSFDHSVFQDLYRHRWPVEEDYRQIKLRKEVADRQLLLEVENWTGTSVEAIYQDFHATVFTKNLAAILAQWAQQSVAKQSLTKKHRYQVNMANLFSKMKGTVCLLLLKQGAITPVASTLQTDDKDPRTDSAGSVVSQKQTGKA